MQLNNELKFDNMEEEDDEVENEIDVLESFRNNSSF